MASTYSPSLRLELIGTGEQSGTWGDTTNTNLGSLIEQAIAGYQSIVMNDSDYVLSSLNGSPDEARNAVLEFTSVLTLTATRSVIVPAVEKTYVVKNSTTGSQSLAVKTSTGVAVTVPNGQAVSLFCNGTDCFQSVSTVNNAVLSGTPTAPTASYGTATTQVATTAFVQTALQAVYPVGSVYINAGVSTNPATLLGFGTWTAIGSGKVLVGLDGADPLFDTLRETGGSKDATVVSHTHTATSTSTSTVTDPGHTHRWSKYPDNGGGSGVTPLASPYSGNWIAGMNESSVTGITVATSTSTNVASAGTSGTNANLQPYVVVCMWQRTA